MSLKKAAILFSSCLLIATLSCTKEQSKKWLVIDAEITSAVTGEPLDAILELQVKDKRIPLSKEDDLIKEILGETVEGRFYIEKELDPNYTQFRLFVYADNPYYTHPYGAESVSIGLISTEKNTLNIELEERYYEMDVTVKNLECGGESDSVWIRKIFTNGNHVEPVLFTGCVDERTNQLPVISFEENISFEVIRKREMMVDTLIRSFTLQPITINEIHIEY